MAVSVLVMTPVRSFGELIQQALQDTDLYRVTLVHNNEQTLERATATQIPVAVLDFDLDPQPEKLIAQLQAIHPDLRIIAIKDESSSEASGLGKLQLAAFLQGAFYLPDLLDALEGVTAGLSGGSYQQVEAEHSAGFPSTAKSGKPTAKFRSAPEWLQDVDRAAQHLTRLSLESAAQAALITRGNQLWAYAGQLPHPAADELAQSVGHYWARDGGSDLARFIRLDANGGEYMLYATGLGGEYVLALAFETEIPFSEIRAQASNLAKELANPPHDIEPVVAVPDLFIVDTDQKEESQPEFIAPPLAPEDVQPEKVIVKFPSDWRPDQDVAEGRQAFFEELLSHVEIPDPEGLPDRTPVATVQAVDLDVQEASPEESGDSVLSRLAAILNTAGKGDKASQVDIDSDLSLRGPPVADFAPEKLTEPETPLEPGYRLESLDDLPIDEGVLANLIDATINDVLPEIDQFTVDFDKTEPLPRAFDTYLKTPLNESIPDYLVDVSLEPETEPHLPFETTISQPGTGIPFDGPFMEE